MLPHNPLSHLRTPERAVTFALLSADRTGEVEAMRLHQVAGSPGELCAAAKRLAWRRAVVCGKGGDRWGP